MKLITTIFVVLAAIILLIGSYHIFIKDKESSATMKLLGFIAVLIPATLIAVATL